ncbi:MAG: tRNA 2-thiouridine(34) synthase MnmA [Gammaproteobacteria bacterium]|nr:tRNA 2-thiouridine(34) synthase MnmA [Gammaproteobacteria bacterium]
MNLTSRPDPAEHRPASQAAPRIMIGMSGGVDSSVAAYLLQRAGYRVEALFMKNWDEDDDAEFCSATQDLADAQAVCEQLALPLHTRNFAAEYWDQVFAFCLEEFRAGRTPNPDVLCNREIKFKVFLDHALALGAEKMATGHYARIARRDGYLRLLKAHDLDKDQSYFLYALRQEQLAHALFPLGELTKPAVRALAAQQGFATHDKKDSTGICFIGERKFKEFLSRYLPAQPGDIVTPDGKIIGRHAGLMYHTLGQRKGLNIGGRRDATEQPWYVAAKNLQHNTLTVVQGDQHPLLFSQSLTAQHVNWIAGEPPALPLRCAAKTRYRQADQNCVIESVNTDTYRVRFDAPQRAVTPGQSVVFYQDDECLGGGIIILETSVDRCKA